MHSRSHLIMLVSKTLYVFAFTFFRDSNSLGAQWFLSLTLFLGSFTVFSHFVSSRPYCDAQTSKVFLVLYNMYLAHQPFQWFLPVVNHSPTAFLCFIVCPRLYRVSGSLYIGLALRACSDIWHERWEEGATHDIKSTEAALWGRIQTIY